MPRQEQHHLPRNLQVRHVPVEVHPIWALQIQRHLTIEHVVDRHRTLGHRAPPTSMEMPYSTPQPAAPPLRTATTHLDGPRRSLFSALAGLGILPKGWQKALSAAGAAIVI